MCSVYWTGLWIHGVWYHYNVVALDSFGRYEDFLHNWVDTLLFIYFAYSLAIVTAGYFAGTELNRAQAKINTVIKSA